MEQENNFLAETKIDLPASAVTAENKNNSSDKKPKKHKTIKIFIWTLVIIFILIIAGLLVDKYTPINLFGTGSFSNLGSNNSSPEGVFDGKNYSAIFLSNGQVYFGVIDRQDKDEIKGYTILKDIYYLQVSNPLQQVPPNGSKQQAQLTLVKLGSELHAPKDYMQINNRQIIFIEKLKESGQVVQAIKQYKNREQK